MTGDPTTLDDPTAPRAPSRREFLLTSGAMLAVARAARSAEPDKRPNILLVHTDDQARWAMGAYGNADIHTPNMDQLAEQGALFERAYVSTPVCSPARATLMTGLDSIQHGIRDWIHPKETIGLAPKFITVGEMLKRSGYATGYVGKWHLGKEPEYHPTNQGFDDFMGFLEGGNSPKNPTLEIEGKTAKREGWLVDMLTEAAMGYIEKNRRRPFFCMVSYRNPHARWRPVQPEDAAPYRGKDLKLFKGSDVNPKRVENILRQYYACCTAVDRNLGRLLAKLTELGLDDNTIVIFTGDNGYMIGQHGLHSKGNAHRLGPPGGCRPNLFDPSLFVPLAIRWPGVVKPKTRIGEMVGQIDFFDTLCDVAGIDKAERPRTEGRSFLPLLRGERAAWRDAIFGSYDQYQYKPEANLRMIRTDRWKLVRNYEALDQTELYDLGNDPHELNNLAGSAEVSAIQKQLAERLVAWQRRLKDPVLVE